jgi:hypothetical protein
MLPFRTPQLSWVTRAVSNPGWIQSSLSAKFLRQALVVLQRPRRRLPKLPKARLLLPNHQSQRLYYLESRRYLHNHTRNWWTSTAL